jgi:hypothetical protein
VATDAAAIPLVAAGGYDIAALIGGLLPWLVSLWIVGVFVVGWRALRQWRHLAQLARRWAGARSASMRPVSPWAPRYSRCR